MEWTEQTTIREAVLENPNLQPQPVREMVTPLTPPFNNEQSSAIQYFITLQNRHLTRLRYLFPEINPAGLKKLLDLCQGDFIRAVDNILHIKQRNCISQQRNYIGSSPTSFGNNVSYTGPYSSTFTPSPIFYNNSVDQIPASRLPMNSTSPNNQGTTNININSNIMVNPHHVQSPNLSTFETNIPSSNKYSNIYPCSLPIQKTNVQSPVSAPMATGTTSPGAENFKSLLFPTSSFPESAQLKSNELYNEPDVIEQYLIDSAELNRFDTNPRYSQQFDSNKNDTEKIATNQVTYKVTPEIFAQRQQSNWIQQQKQKQYENHVLKLMSGSQVTNADVEQVYMTLHPVQDQRECMTSLMQTVSTAIDEENSEGKMDCMKLKNDIQMNNEELSITNTVDNILCTEEAKTYNVQEVGANIEIHEESCSQKDTDTLENINMKSLEKEEEKLASEASIFDSECGVLENEKVAMSVNNTSNTGTTTTTVQTHNNKIPPLGKNKQFGSNGINSWGYLEENASSVESSLVIDTDVEQCIDHHKETH